ncbi:MAG TPA: NUDIX hydrolase [Chitinophagaceae bacterium]|nr:NUDIX hydrolase [Chitinophagaceae bacterium]
MYIKIYFGDKPLFLCNEVDKTLEPYVHHDDTVFIDELNNHTIKTMIHEMQQPGVHAGIFLHPDLDALRQTFFRKFNLVRAAGGLVWNEQGALLMIYRKGKWDLPKGKLDPGERLEDCAVREVAEETGLKRLHITAPLPPTYHTYHEGTHFILKETHWYHMEAPGSQPLIPQTEEDIRDIRWVAPPSLPEYEAASYPAIVDLIRLEKPGA